MANKMSQGICDSATRTSVVESSKKNSLSDVAKVESSPEHLNLILLNHGVYFSCGSWEPQTTSAMSHRSHVPKFGSWDKGKDDVGYSACFDNARHEKARVRINPNDPEENPEVFMPGPIGDVERIFHSVQAVSSTKRHGGQLSASAHRRSHSDQPKAGYAHGLSSTMQRGVRYSRERNASDPYDHPKRSRAPKHGDLGNVRIRHAASSGSARRDKTSIKMNPNDPEENPGTFSWRTGGTCSFFRSSSTKWSSSQKQHGAGSAGSHRRSFSDELKRRSFGSKKGFSPSVQRSSGHSGQRNRDQQVDYSHLGATPVPVFGDWDETDPNSGDGYTERFNRIKEEKENASSNFRPALSIPINYSDSPTKERFLSYLFKTYCCVFSGNSRSRDSADFPRPRNRNLSAVAKGKPQTDRCR